MWTYSPELHLCIVSAVNIVSVALTALGLIAVRFGSDKDIQDVEETPIFRRNEGFVIVFV